MSFLSYKGEGIMPAVDFDSSDTLKEYIPTTPDKYMNVIFYGKKTVVAEGQYKFCVSDYGGAHIFVDDKLIADDGVPHARRVASNRLKPQTLNRVLDSHPGDLPAHPPHTLTPKR